MTLEEVKMGGLFMFEHMNCQEIYKKKKRLDNEWYIVGLPNVYDEFAAHKDRTVVSYDTDNKNK